MKNGRHGLLILENRGNALFRAVTEKTNSGIDLEIADRAVIQELSNAFRRKNTG